MGIQGVGNNLPALRQEEDQITGQPQPSYGLSRNASLMQAVIQRSAIREDRHRAGFAPAIENQRSAVKSALDFLDNM